jgi:hypothetical protein
MRTEFALDVIRESLPDFRSEILSWLVTVAALLVISWPWGQKTEGGDQGRNESWERVPGFKTCWTLQSRPQQSSTGRDPSLALSLLAPEVTQLITSTVNQDDLSCH